MNVPAINSQEVPQQLGITATCLHRHLPRAPIRLLAVALHGLFDHTRSLWLFAVGKSDRPTLGICQIYRPVLSLPTVCPSPPLAAFAGDSDHKCCFGCIRYRRTQRSQSYGISDYSNIPRKRPRTPFPVVDDP